MFNTLTYTTAALHANGQGETRRTDSSDERFRGSYSLISKRGSFGPASIILCKKDLETARVGARPREIPHLHAHALQRPPSFECIWALRAPKDARL